MPRELDQPRPRSTIADMVDLELVEQATEGASKSLTHKTEFLDTTPTPAPATPQRTGEHTNIQKMYRLTPSAHRTLQELSRALSSNLGFDLNNSAVIRSILWVMQDAAGEIERVANAELKPRHQPSTAIGNEHARAELERDIGEFIRKGIINRFN